jgi:hypothetical protein
MSGRPLFVTQGFLNVLPDNFGSYRFGHFHRKGRKVFFLFLGVLPGTARQDKCSALSRRTPGRCAGFAVHSFGISDVKLM